MPNCALAYPVSFYQHFINAPLDTGRHSPSGRLERKGGFAAYSSLNDTG